MGYSIVGKYIPGKVQTFRRFVCDTTADVSTLPINVAFGSESFCVEDGLTYILQNDGVWALKELGVKINNIAKVYEIEAVRNTAGTAMYVRIPEELREAFWAYPKGTTLLARGTFHQNGETKTIYMRSNDMYYTLDEREYGTMFITPYNFFDRVNKEGQEQSYYEGMIAGYYSPSETGFVIDIIGETPEYMDTAVTYYEYENGNRIKTEYFAFDTITIIMFTQV